MATDMEKLFIVFLILSPNVYAEGGDSFTCYPKMITGFDFDKKEKDWKLSEYTISGISHRVYFDTRFNKYIVSSNSAFLERFCENEYSDDPYGYDIYGVDNYGFLQCEGFKLNIKNLRYSNYDSDGYVGFVAGDKDIRQSLSSVYMEIGSCVKS